MAMDAVSYLNREDPAVAESAPFFSKLLQAIGESKQGRAPASQWLSMIKALTQKGVKQLEMEEADFLPWLETQPAGEVLTKEQLLAEISRRYYTVKEVVLGSPKYDRYRQPEGVYSEYLYVANSERANIEDEIEEIEWRMEELSFEPELLATDPGVALRLELQRAALMRERGKAIDFQSHHFSDKLELGKHGKNLLAHCRVTIRGEIYFIEELQSDWAQYGRRNDWRTVPRGPLVTNTEAWAGLVMRRQLQVAANTPGIKRFAWITESMRNGGLQRLDEEKANVEKRDAYRAFIASSTAEHLSAFGDMSNMTPEQVKVAKEGARLKALEAARRAGKAEPPDMLNDFYVSMIPKLVDKALGKSGGKTGFAEMTLANSRAEGTYGSHTVPVPNKVTVPCVEFTPEVHKHLLATRQPMYSRSPLRQSVRFDTKEAVAELSLALATAREMLGSARHVRFASHVYDVATGRKVAGRYINKLVQVSLHARDVVEATEHECFHFAVDNLMTQQELGMMQSHFAPGTELNWRVRDHLKRRGDIDAANQCSNAEETAAHAFTLWKRGEISIAERPVQRLFADLVSLVKDVTAWFRRTVLEQRCTTVEELFEALAGGRMAQRQDSKRRFDEEAIQGHGAALDAAPNPFQVQRP